jgi:hypothetical protein
MFLSLPVEHPFFHVFVTPCTVINFKPLFSSLSLLYLSPSFFLYHRPKSMYSSLTLCKSRLFGINIYIMSSPIKPKTRASGGYLLSHCNSSLTVVTTPGSHLSFKPHFFRKKFIKFASTCENNISQMLLPLKAYARRVFYLD